ncbi:MAG: hypothetical protein ACREXT_09540, partial [Gammaproteobacteria bacterium]
LYVSAGLALIFLWPYPAEYERMLYPMLPLILLQGAAGLNALRAPRAQAGNALLITLVLVAILPFALLVQSRLAAPPADSTYRPYLRTRAWYFVDPATAFGTMAYVRAIIDALQDIQQQTRVPAGDCLVAIKPALVALYSGLPVDGPPAFTRTSDEIEHAIRHGRCHYLFMMLAPSPSYPQQYFPYQRLERRLTVLTFYHSPLLAKDRPAAILARLAP